MRRALLRLFALALVLSLAPVSAASAAARPTITDPAFGAFLTSATPAFQGTGVTNGDGAILNVYTGTASSGIPSEAVATTVSNGHWSASLPIPLANGFYTATLVENPTSTSPETSTPVLFSVSSSTPALTLTLPSTTVTTPSPTFNGSGPVPTAGSSQVYLTIYAGPSTDSSPLLQVPAAINADGSFSITTTPGLQNGTYTAVASETQMSGGFAYSPTLTFNVNVAPPALTITSPAQNGSLPEGAPVFGGTAGTDYGDNQSVTVTLYAGRSAGGTPLGTHTVTPSSGSWNLSWPQHLAAGTYTVVATQSDIGGQVTTVTHVFTIGPPGVIRGNPAIAANGTVSVQVYCRAGAGACVGNVLVLSTKRLRPVAGGPTGILRLLFRRYDVKAGATGTVSARLGRAQLNALKHAGAERLKVITVYSSGSKLVETSATTHPIKVR